MKVRRVKISSLFLISTFLVCCVVSNNPKDVAEHFIKASIRMDFKDAKKYATPETAKMLDFVQNITAKTKANTSTLKDMKIEMGEESIKGDDATVKYKKEGSSEEYYINLKKIDGKWLVAASTGDLTTGNDTQAGEKDAPADSSAIHNNNPHENGR
jgi:hypothetical protein